MRSRDRRTTAAGGRMRRDGVQPATVSAVAGAHHRHEPTPGSREFDDELTPGEEAAIEN
jgi:hypothetical protein